MLCSEGEGMQRSKMKQFWAGGLGVLILFGLSCGTDISRRLEGDGSSERPATTRAAPCTFSQPAGDYAAPFNVELASATTGAYLRYTQDGNDPTESSSLYVAPIRVATAVTLKCVAYATDFLVSEVRSATYTFGGGPTPTPTPNPNPTYEMIEIEVEIGIDGVDKIRIEDGVLDLIHVSGNAAGGGPLIRITRPDGSVDTIYPWVLSPYHQETGVTCDLPSNECVSLPLGLGLSHAVSGGDAYVDGNSISISVGRGSVTVNTAGEVVMSDSASGGWSGYWFRFNYWYEVPAN